MTSYKKISVALPVLSGNEKAYVNEALDSTWVSSRGPFIDRFEAAVADMAGVRYAVACNNGTTSLHLALVALDLQPGDEVIMPALTYIATANCVRYCGAKPVLVDNDVNTFNIDPAAIEAAITPRTKGIMPVHLYGQPAAMGPIRSIADKYGLWLLEDAAEAHGARYQNKPVGGLGTCGSFSFFGNKIVTTGEGGALTTDDRNLADRMRLFRNQGMDINRRYWHPVIGYNYRMTNIAAAIGVAQMERLDIALANRSRVAKAYDELLESFEGVIARPVVAQDSTHAFWMYTIQLCDGVKATRDEVMAGMQSEGIETRPVFYPLNQMPPYYDESLQVPNATKCAARGINLPTHEQLDENDLSRIVESLIRTACPDK